MQPLRVIDRRVRGQGVSGVRDLPPQSPRIAPPRSLDQRRLRTRSHLGTGHIGQLGQCRRDQPGVIHRQRALRRRSRYDRSLGKPPRQHHPRTGSTRRQPARRTQERAGAHFRIERPGPVQHTDPTRPDPFQRVDQPAQLHHVRVQTRTGIDRPRGQLPNRGTQRLHPRTSSRTPVRYYRSMVTSASTRDSATAALEAGEHAVPVASPSPVGGVREADRHDERPAGQLRRLRVRRSHVRAAIQAATAQQPVAGRNKLQDHRECPAARSDRFVLDVHLVDGKGGCRCVRPRPSPTGSRRPPDRAGSLPARRPPARPGLGPDRHEPRGLGAARPRGDERPRRRPPRLRRELPRCRLR